MGISLICRRCHHVRDVNEARYCEPCDAELRAMEKPRVRVPEAVPLTGPCGDVILFDSVEQTQAPAFDKLPEIDNSSAVS
jgi:hypothetical protein